MMILSNLPSDISKYIMKYLFSNCDYCNHITHYTKLKYNYKITEYKTIFDNNYGFESFIVFDKLCDDCSNSLEYSMLSF